MQLIFMDGYGINSLSAGKINGAIKWLLNLKFEEWFPHKKIAYKYEILVLYECCCQPDIWQHVAFYRAWLGQSN